MTANVNNDRSEWEPRKFHRDLQEIDLRAMESDTSDDSEDDASGSRHFRRKRGQVDTAKKVQSVGPTQVYRSVSHVVGYAPVNTTSHCKVCGKGFVPTRIR